MQIFSIFSVIFVFVFFYLGTSASAQECNLDGSVSKTITVDKSGKGNFNTVQAAIDSVPSRNNKWIKIHVRRGIYSEKVTVPRDKPCIILEGEGSKLTTITGKGFGPLIDQSSTFTSLANNFVAKRITFKNSYNRFWAFSRASLTDLNSDYLESPMSQAVAARILGDKSSFHECAFLGLQDTLWDALGRHYFNSCYIEGAVDFIFGQGQSFYENCQINVTAHLLLPTTKAGYLTAQSRQSAKDPSGFVFFRPNIFGSSQVFLGRAYGPFSRVIFQDAFMNIDIAPQGWFAWRNAGSEPNFTYAEVNCKGPRYNTLKRVKYMKLLTPNQLKQYTRSAFIDQGNWIRSQP